MNKKEIILDKLNYFTEKYGRDGTMPSLGYAAAIRDVRDFIQSLTTEPQVDKVTAKEYLQNKYPEMRGDKWNSHDVIDDEWIARMMEDYATQSNAEGTKKTAEEIYASMIDNMPFEASESQKPYILEAIRIGIKGNAEAMREHAIGFKREDIIDAYVQGSIRENPCVDEQEVNRMIANGNVYWNINFSGLKDLNL